MALGRLPTPHFRGLGGIERWLEAERDHLPLWLPVALGSGIAAWFVFPTRDAWLAWMTGAMVMAGMGALFGWRQRWGRSLFWAGLLAVLGCGLAWSRAQRLDHPVLDRPAVVSLSGTVERIEERPAEGDAESKLRLTVAISTIQADKGGIAPIERVRITLKAGQRPEGLATGAQIAVRARLAPPAGAALPGGYDFARAAWFMGLGATGTALGEISMLSIPGKVGIRDRLSRHVRAQIDGSPGGIASAFASGDRGGIAPEDEDAMRASGLTHLLSISGLHITAVIAAAIFLSMRLLAFWPRLALRWPLLIISAGIGASAGVAYTLLTGAEVPTIRSCIAALLVLAGLAMGREALTLRLVATGALIILILWPEALVGASFQLSFAAITAIVAFHEARPVKVFLQVREEGNLARFARSLGGLLATGLVVEIALAPIALFHFHKSGLYGALANLVAIPWTTFVVMPLEALALLFDVAGLGAPFWWATGKSIALLLWLARSVASWPGAVASLPAIPDGAYALMLGGGFWMLLWTQRVRWIGALPCLAGALWALTVPPPDILITGDGRHLAVRASDGRMVMLREKAGDFIQTVMAERAGDDAPPLPFDTSPDARCSRDMCVARVSRGTASWLVGATRSNQFLPWKEVIALCSRLDLVVSDRRLPPGCTPKVLKADRSALAQIGGLAIIMGQPVRIEQVRDNAGEHPWEFVVR